MGVGMRVILLIYRMRVMGWRTGLGERMGMIKWGEEGRWVEMIVMVGV